LKPRLRNVNVTLKVVDIGDPRSVTSRRDGSTLGSIDKAEFCKALDALA